jgi:hypothetical protein
MKKKEHKNMDKHKRRMIKNFAKSVENAALANNAAPMLGVLVQENGMPLLVRHQICDLEKIRFLGTILQTLKVEQEEIIECD